MASQSNDYNSLRFNFEQATNVVDLNEINDGSDSDETVLGEELFEDRFVRPTPEVEFLRSQPRAPSPDDDAAKRLESYSLDGRTYRPGKSVELIDGDFLRITAIVNEPEIGVVYLKGLRFRRNKFSHGMLEFKRNELSLILHLDEADGRDVYHQSVEVVQLEDVVRIRDLIKTNRPFPQCSFREVDPNWQSQGKEYTLEHGRLVCRTKYIEKDKNEGCLQFLEEAETDDGYATNPKELRCQFRGETELGGACARWSDEEKGFNDRRGVENDQMNRRDGRRYTLGDGFCGAGGISSGARAAGLRVDWGFDFDPAAIQTFSRNFYGARCEAVAAHEFVTIINQTEDFKVDILHVSPPCQTFSPYHVHQGQNDELNQATFFAIEELLKKVKPRIVTLEETFGLTRMLKHQDWFRAMVQMFTKLGFSVRWKVFNLCDFGLAQPRKRLIVFASCPGEPLPDWPTATHVKAADQHRFPHLLPFTTVNDVISQIPTNTPLHDPDQMPPRNEPPYNGNLPLRRTICCSGNSDFHPSGKRGFTLRELACLQGFPVAQEFGPTRTRMQIGNAVPPIVAKVFFEYLRRHLLRVDGLL